MNMLTILTFPSANGKCHTMFLLDFLYVNSTNPEAAEPSHSSLEDGIDPHSHPVL